MSYKISIIVPVYNVQSTIENCFLSLQNQTIGFENLEIIFVNDCSTDRSYDIINIYTQMYDNIKYFSTEENSGVAGKPRNIGLKHATSDYVMFLDPDDTLTSDACKILYDKIIKSDVDIVSGLHTKKKQYNLEEEIYPGLIINTFTDPNYTKKERKKQLDLFISQNPNEFYLNTINEKPSVLGNFGLSSKIFKSKFIKSNNISFPEYIPGEDSVFLFNAFICAKGIIFLNKIIYSYTTFRNDENNKSLTFQSDMNKNIGRIKSYKLMLEISRKNNKVYEYTHYILLYKLIYFLKTFIIIPNIPDKDISNLFNESYELFHEIKNNNINVPPEFNDLFNNIINKNYDLAINNCHELRNLYHSSQNKKTIPYIDELNVAVIMDPFTYNSFSNEFNAIILEPDTWEDVFKENSIDLLFVESAFNGVSKNDIINGIAIEGKCRPWKGKLGVNLSKGWDNRKILFNILAYCVKFNIPTIFWNKEDPTSFDNENYNFIDTALNFNYIFTTDADIIPRYNVRGHDKVYPLLFASQIKLYNPIERGNRSDDIVFAGSWYEQFPDRCNIMKDMFNKIISSKYNLKIYDRGFDLSSKNRIFPDKYTPYIHPGVPQTKMPGVYKESKFSLNINTVTGSHTMFARRVYELMSSNTFVISNYSVGIYDLFKDNVLYLDKMDKLEINEDDVDRICEENLYNVLENHTYHERFKYILDTINFRYKERNKIINLIYFIDDLKYEINDIINDFNKINYYYKRCILVIKNSDRLNELNEYEKYNIKIILKENLLNTKFTQEDFFLIRKIDDENINNFIKKALLHYKYLDKDISIKENINKRYCLDKTDDFDKVIFNYENYDIFIRKELKNEDNTIPIYYI